MENEDYITQFIESVELERTLQEDKDAEAHKYDELNKPSIIAGWRRYRALMNGDIVFCGHDVEDIVFVENADKQDKAFALLARLYKTLQPFEDSIVRDHDEKACIHEEWQKTAYDIIREYHTQKPIFIDGVPMMGDDANHENANHGQCKTLDECLTDEIKNTTHGVAIFQWAIDQLLMKLTPNGIVWIGTHALYGYFVDVVSDKLDIRLSNDRITWIKFRFVLNHEKMLETAKQKVTAYKNGENRPEGWREIASFIRHLE